MNLGIAAGSGRSVTLARDLRDKHLYIAGATGTGKSKLLESLVWQDIMANRTSGCGMLVLDPHGSLYDSILARLAMADLDRKVILIDMRDANWVVSYNVLRHRQAEPAVIVENFVQAMAHVWGQSGTDQTPLFARWAGNTLRVLYENGLTLADAVHLLGSSNDVRAALTATVQEPHVRQDWERASSWKPAEFDDRIGSTINRLRRFLGNKNLRAVFGQGSASLDLGTAIEEGAIILVSLAREKARVSKEDAELFATLLLTDLWTAAQERGKRAGVRPFYVYLDEFQRFLTPTIAENLDEARGFGLCLTLAHQFPKQLIDSGVHGRRVYNSVMENASSKVVFRLTDPENLEPLAKWLFLGVMNPDEIKHALYSTKVMGYREETRVTRSTTRMTASSYAAHESDSSGDSHGESGIGGEVSGEFTGANFSSTAGSTIGHQEAFGQSESEASVLIPQMGKELSGLQFRSMEEQVHRAMATLFGQARQHFTARLAESNAPVSVKAPDVPPAFVYPERLKKYVTRQMSRHPFIIESGEALRRLIEREAAFGQQFGRQNESIEPTTARRRVKRVW